MVFCLDKHEKDGETYYLCQLNTACCKDKFLVKVLQENPPVFFDLRKLQTLDAEASKSVVEAIAFWQQEQLDKAKRAS